LGGTLEKVGGVLIYYKIDIYIGLKLKSERQIDRRDEKEQEGFRVTIPSTRTTHKE